MSNRSLAHLCLFENSLSIGGLIRLSRGLQGRRMEEKVWIKNIVMRAGRGFRISMVLSRSAYRQGVLPN